jgi:cytoskeletal protein CcmA (bactofilin family)
MSETQSFVGPGAFFEGKLSFSGVVQIDGHVRGDIRADGILVVGPSGVVEAEVEVASVIIRGTVVGQVSAKDRVEVHPTGRISGRVKTPRLIVQEGAELNTQIEMGEA